MKIKQSKLEYIFKIPVKRRIIVALLALKLVGCASHKVDYTKKPFKVSMDSITKTVFSTPNIALDSYHDSDSFGDINAYIYNVKPLKGNSFNRMVIRLNSRKTVFVDKILIACGEFNYITIKERNGDFNNDFDTRFVGSSLLTSETLDIALKDSQYKYISNCKDNIKIDLSGNVGNRSAYVEFTRNSSKAFFSGLELLKTLN